VNVIPGIGCGQSFWPRNGLAPVSYLLAGLASAVDPALMFGAAGAIVMAATGRAALVPALRRVD
jgi:hypothetical protein